MRFQWCSSHHWRYRQSSPHACDSRPSVRLAATAIISFFIVSQCLVSRYAGIISAPPSLWDETFCFGVVQSQSQTNYRLWGVLLRFATAKNLLNCERPIGKLVAGVDFSEIF